MKRVLLLLAILTLLPFMSRADLANVAFNGTAYSNRPLWGPGNWNISMLNDGNKSGVFHGDATIEAGFAYSIDFGKSYPVKQIKVYPRQDGCCPERLRNFRVSVHNDDNGQVGAEVWGTDLYTDGSNPGAAAGTVVTVDLPSPQTGRWVQVKALSDPVPSYFLQMTELEVFADVPPEEVNRALNAPVQSNRPLFGAANPQALTDGFRPNVVHGDEIIDPGFAYTIDLGTTISLNKIIIWARQDGCCPERLTNYRVSILDDNNGQPGNEVWKADLHTDFSNPGADRGSKDELTAALDAAGQFKGRFIRILSLEDPVQSYALQMGEVEAYGAPAGAVNLTITQHPQDTAAGLGQSVTFRVTALAAGGDAGLITYQWQKDEVDIPGANEATYTTPPIGTSDGGKKFRCVVGYPGLQGIPSNAATVTINVAYRSLVTSNRPIWGGNQITMLVDGNRNNVFHLAENPEAGAAYEINLGTAYDLSKIIVWARQDNCCPERLTNYRVSVHKDNNGTIGDAVWSADLHADGSNPGAAPGSRDEVTADLDPAGKFQGQWIRILALDDPLNSYALQMTELEAYGTPAAGVQLLITQQPQSTTAGLGLPATFQVVATSPGGDPGLITYQWQKDRVDIEGATTATYMTPPATEADEGKKFRCIVSYPGLPSIPTDEVSYRINLAIGSVVISNRPLWIPGGWSLDRLVDGNPNTFVHGDVDIEAGYKHEIQMKGPVAITQIDLYPRQDGCCPERLSNFRVSIHKDNNGAIGDSVWSADLFTDGSNPGSGAGLVVNITPDLDPAGKFEGQWIRILALDDPVLNYFLQIGDIQVFGKLLATPVSVSLVSGPKDVASAPGRTARFNVEAKVLNGDPALLTYRWQKNQSDIPGATAATYITPPLVAADENAKFRCIISYPGFADITTPEATLTFDFNYAKGSLAYSNRPLWGGGNISTIVDGDRNGIIHGDTGIQAGMAYTINMALSVAIERIDIYPRQDGCCPERLANFRVSVHQDNNGQIGAAVWSVDLFTDGSNAGSGAGTVVTLTPDLDPAGRFEGQWIQLLALDDPVPNYHMQMNEVEVYGRAQIRPSLAISKQGGEVTLSWAAEVTGFILESADAIPSANWNAVAGVQNNKVTVPIGSANRFYRLRKQ
ncbi:MAG: discoidin domain-containing protein [Verrucomicrobiota bacterium]